MRRAPLLVLYLTVFIDLLGFGIILPMLPFYARHFGAGGLGVGILFTAYSAMQLLGAPLLGRLSDRIGRRPVLLASLAGSAISMTLAGLSTTLPALVGARALAGLFGGSIAPAQAYIGDVTKPEDRARYMGLLGAAIGMGFVLGPGLGAALAPYGFHAAAFVAAALAAVNLVFAWFTLVEPERHVGHAAARSLATLAATLRRPQVGSVVVAFFFSTLAFVSMEATFALLGEKRFGMDATRLGLAFMFIGVVVAVAQGALVGRLSRALGERGLATLGLVLMGAALAAIPFVPKLALLVLVLGALGLGQAFSSPAMTSLLSRQAGAEVQGGTLGAGQSAAALARATGPVLAGWLYDRGIPLAYLAAALAALVAVWFIRRAGIAPSEAPIAQQASG